MSNEFTKLNLDQSGIENCLSEFCSQHNMSYKELPNSGNQSRFEISKPGQELATIIFFFRNDGTTTIQHNQGKNPELSLQVAQYVKSKLCNEAVKSLNLAIAGINQECFSAIYEEISKLSESNDICIQSSAINGGILYQLHSQQYQDRLNLSYYAESCKLLIQGKPLSCYKVVAYALSYALDTDTLGKILYKKDDADAIIARPEVAKEYLRNVLPKSFAKLPTAISDLLVSSYCVRFASPQLPEYSLLTYAELRALEGIIKEQLSRQGFSPLPRFIGELFDEMHNPNKCILKSSEIERFNGSNLPAIEAAYTYYKKRRHSIFHMDEMVEASAKIESLQEAINICNKVYELIENIFE
ncbi:type II toxin-antitoxin system RnlA family toxin [Neisseria sp. Dent CA1/247]|uniref:type II toxin-antitoxin system RnlA family toxin n=1 Tax=Neisseria sp. Dent CA1/247 TaxID=2912675 RepID=UPI001FD61C8A|nr:type II toxin-antitoxin system RnlA family toxin [Neisseria sp. Dent CA1/247]UOO77577.1 type II toxin-antitoxin system RnlA family toxin [Neisseria sp. Dent CA1/247]